MFQTERICLFADVTEDCHRGGIAQMRSQCFGNKVILYYDVHIFVTIE